MSANSSENNRTTKIINGLPDHVAKALLLSSVVGLSLISRGLVSTPPATTPSVILVSMLTGLSPDLPQEDTVAIGKLLFDVAHESIDELIGRLEQKEKVSNGDPQALALKAAMAAFKDLIVELKGEKPANKGEANV